MQELTINATVKRITGRNVIRVSVQLVKSGVLNQIGRRPDIRKRWFVTNATSKQGGLNR